MQKGTTPSWARPVRVEFEVEEGFNDINIVEALATTGMASSKAEAKRLIEQNVIWLDNGVSDLPESTVWDRLHKVKLEQGKFLLIESGDLVCIGKTVDDAVCHRIVFVQKNLIHTETLVQCTKRRFQLWQDIKQFLNFKVQASSKLLSAKLWIKSIFRSNV